MQPEIKQRIKQIKNGQIPQGYKKTKVCIVPNDWKCERIENFCTMRSGKTITSQFINEYDTYPCYGGNGLRGYTSEYTHNGKYILIGRQGALCGNVVLAVGKFFASEHAIVVYCLDNITEFFYYLFDYMNLNKYSESSAQPGLSVEKILRLFSLFPPIEEQKKIAKILSTQDKVIELKEKLIKEKQKQKKYLMQNLLTGKIRLKGFTDEWKKYVMGNLGNTYSGLSGKNKDDFGKGKPYIPYTNIFLNPIIDVNELGYVDVLENEKQSKVCYGDIFFTTSSETPEEVGMSSVLLENVDELYLNSFCFGFRLNNFSVLSPIYASHYFRGDTFRNILNRLAQGVTRFNLSKNNLLKSILLLPPLEEQKAIAEILSAQDKEIELLQKELEEEKQKKKALMQLLLTGIARV